MHVAKGDWNETVLRNNRNKVGPVSGLGLARLRTLRNVYGVGARPYVQLLQYARKACADTYITEISLNVALSKHYTHTPFTLTLFTLALYIVTNW